jgi:hypothetical protein
VRRLRETHGDSSGSALTYCHSESRLVFASPSDDDDRLVVRDIDDDGGMGLASSPSSERDDIPSFESRKWLIEPQDASTGLGLGPDSAQSSLDLRRLPHARTLGRSLRIRSRRRLHRPLSGRRSCLRHLRLPRKDSRRAGFCRESRSGAPSTILIADFTHASTGETKQRSTSPEEMRTRSAAQAYRPVGTCNSRRGLRLRVSAEC